MRKINISSYQPSRFLMLLVTATIFSAEVIGAENIIKEGRVGALEEIIVTAQRREESLQETPISITAFSQDQLDKIGAFDVSAVAALTPNVQMDLQVSDQASLSFSMRGLSGPDPILLNEAVVGFYMDGVYIARNAGSAFEMTDLERIEVLRGPQGTLYGRNSTGGAINVITVKPAGEWKFKQFVSRGNYDYWRTTTTVDTQEFYGVSAKFSYMKNERDGFLRNAYGNSGYGAIESEVMRLAVRWAPIENLTFDYVYDRSERETSGNNYQIVYVRPLQLSVGGPIYRQAAEIASRKRQKTLLQGYATKPNSDSSDVEGHALTATWESNHYTLKSITSYRDWKSILTDGDYGSFPSDGVNVLNGSGGIIPQGNLVSLYRYAQDSSQHQFTQEIQLFGDLFNEKLTYLIGVYYFKENVNQVNPQSFVFPAALAYGALPISTQNFLCVGPCYGKDAVLGQPSRVYGGDSKSLAVFGQFDYLLTEKLKATLGARFTRDKKEDFLTNDSIIRNEGINRVYASDTWSNFSPSFTMTYEMSDATTIYGKVSTGYRAGGFSAGASTSMDFIAPFDEESIISYEAGAKSDWLDSRLRLNSAVFYYNFKDMQVTQFVANPVTGASSQVFNAGKQTAKGLELELTAVPTDGLLVQLSYGYVDAEYKKFVTGVTNPVTGFSTGVNEDISGWAKVPHSPKNSGSIAVQYELNPFSFGVLSFWFDATYTDSRVFNPVLNLYTSTGSQTLLNARATLADVPFGRGKIKFSTWIKNIKNKEYKSWGIDFASLGYATNFWREPRTYGFDVVYEVD